MRDLLFGLVLIIAVSSCNASGNEKKSSVNTTDSNLTVTPVTPIAVDTDDHNKAGVSEVALDSPVGPRRATDTTHRK